METKPIGSTDDLKADPFTSRWADGLGPSGARHISEIQKEYERIDHDWLALHYKTSVGMVLFALAVECTLALYFVRSDLLTTTVPNYIWKYIVVPSGCNFLCIAVDTLVMRSARLSKMQKADIISLMLVGICFILFTVHSIFVAAYYIFAAAILLTTVYANYRITGATALASLTCMTVSELFISWDTDKVSVFDSALRMGNFLAALAILSAFSIMCMVVIQFMRKKNEVSIQIEIERHRLLCRLQVDELTGVFNRQALHTALANLGTGPAEQDTFLAIADLDNFKGINDRWGHHLGDRCLTEFSKILRENCQDYMPFRYGGDEFCLLFQGIEMEQARTICARLQKKVSSLRIGEEPALVLTVSMGIAAYTDQIDGTRLFINADRALYEAKNERNAIRIFPVPADAGGAAVQEQMQGE